MFQNPTVAARATRPVSWQTGITLIEVLVVLGTLGLLSALILPAVQSARAASQRIRCQNQQRQLALALHAYHEQHNCLPPVTLSGGEAGCPPPRGLSFVFSELGLGSPCKQAASGVEQIPALLCPADGEIDHVPRPMSYVVNSTPGRMSGSSFLGPFGDGGRRGPLWGVVRLSEIADGTSNTVALSEVSTYRSGGTRQAAERLPLRYLWWVNVNPLSRDTQANPLSPSALTELSQAADLSIHDCRHGPREFLSLPDSKFPSWGPSNGIPNYTHWIPPNTPACNSTGSATTFIGLSHGARSMHSAGVNVTFLDGHAMFVSENVDLKVWRAIGTRDGGESEASGALQ